MSILEEKIRKNKELFNQSEPSAGHLENFHKKINQTFSVQGQQPKSNRWVWRFAAAVTILLAIGIFITQKGPHNTVLAAGAITDNDLSEELAELKQYYEFDKLSKLDQIENHTCNNNEDCEKLKEVAEEEVANLEQNNLELENELKENKNNSKVMKAIVTNYQIMSRVLDDILDHLDRSRNQL